MYWRVADFFFLQVEMLRVHQRSKRSIDRVRLEMF